jgi:hypothetical protein
MVHSPEVSVRFARMEKSIHSGSLGVLAGGSLLFAAGWIVVVAPLLLLGIGVLVIDCMSWMIRLHLLRQRRQSTPGMIFISQDGVEAILPDNSGIQLKWGEIEVTRITLQRRIGVLALRTYPLHERGITLKSSRGMICLTEQLSGYGELLDILADLGIPVASPSSRLLGIQGGYSDWHHRLEYRARQSRN